MIPRPRASALAAHLAALLAAALAPALVFAPLGLRNSLAGMVFVVALAHALLLGAPLYLLARRVGWATPINALWVGALIGAVPVTVLLLAGGTPDFSSSGGVATVVGGVRTMAGWFELLAAAAFFGFWGAAGGLVFWWVLKLLHPAASSPADRAPSPSNRREPRRAHAAAAGALATAAIILGAPWAFRDRSCHSPLPDGQTSIPPGLNVILDVGTEEWSRVVSELGRFAEQESLSIRDRSEDRPGVVRILSTSVCSADGVLISVNEQDWVGSPAPPDFERVDIPVYSPTGADWRPVTRRLVARLEQAWPGRVHFEDLRGRRTPRPADLDASSPERPATVHAAPGVTGEHPS